MRELFRLTVSDIRDLLDKREISVMDIVDSIYQRIDAVEGRVKAFVTLTKRESHGVGQGCAGENRPD